MLSACKPDDQDAGLVSSSNITKGCDASLCFDQAVEEMREAQVQQAAGLAAVMSLEGRLREALASLPEAGSAAPQQQQQGSASADAQSGLCNCPAQFDVSKVAGAQYVTVTFR